MLRKSVFLLLVCLLAAVTLAAQQPQPIEYIAALKVKPGSESTLLELVKKYDKPLMDRLMTEGAVLAWGLETVVIHRDGGINYIFWWVTPDYAGMDKVFAGFEEMEGQITPEDQKRFAETIDPDKHHDHMLRVIHVNINEGPPATLPYTVYSSVKVKRGHGRDWRKLFEKYSQPVFDKLVADGTIHGYGIDVEDFHTEHPGLRWIWIVTTSLAAFDQIDAAFRADRQARSEEERATIRHKFRKVTVGGEHRDFLFRRVLGAGGGEGQ